MKNILLVGLLSFGYSTAHAEIIIAHRLLTPITWTSERQANNRITVKSIYRLHNQNIKTIRHLFKNSIPAFLKYEDIDGTSCTQSNFEIRIVSPEILNSSDYFVETGMYYYARYFGLANVLYVTRSSFKHTDDFTHEFSHYFYDDCKIGLMPKDEEKRAEKFELFYRKYVGYGRSNKVHK